jgi:16S rRNA (cytosine967-C5)-methyltransferase
LKTNSHEVTNILNKNSIDFRKDKYLDNYYKIKKFDNNNIVKNLIQSGYIYIQNPSSGFVVKLINAKKNNTILDACCAPGGKSSLISSNLNNLVELHSLDINDNRISRTKNNFKRLNVKNVKFICDDAMNFKSQILYDKILIDLPCSSSGTIRKNPDIKWKLTKTAIKKFQQTQYKILTNLSKSLNINGEIIYCTCSLFFEENEKNVVKFLKNYTEFEISDIDVDLPQFTLNNIGGITILPTKHDYEGMFAIKFRKNA